MTYGWLIANSSLQTDKFNDYSRWFQKAAARKGIELDLVWNSDLQVAFDRFGKREFRPPANRGIPDFIHFADKDLHLGEHLEANGIRLFNSTRAIGLCDNKARMHAALSGHGLPVPKTVIAPKVYDGCEQGNPYFLKQVISLLGLPLIVKEAYGSFGRQVFKAETPEELEAIVRGIGSREMIFQEMITESTGTDVRLNVVGDEVVASMKRTSVTDFRANVTTGGSAEPWVPSTEEKELAVSAARAAGADFAGVDLLFGRDGPVLCEINSNPHIRSIYECTGVDVAPYMIDYILNAI
ncbi:ATP-grasp domain-containing protein [Alteribacter natronophilus]|uniref:ATP-grasp domain-containing protein n=1 Tax=Alteribacter natronophilus TaxID=2583810 RepID=UPI00110F3836|nr:RimK family alpha-L-glutamate ligase [Alteribacter natronophilus]TMW71603.1 RimK family alpha-L-glutamate ligase [Alteribacter natronophilus]